MTSIIYITILILLNIFELKKLEKISNNDLFYILSLDTLSFSLYVFMYTYKYYDISLINIISIIFLLYFYIKEKCSFFKTTLLIINILLAIKILI